MVLGLNLLSDKTPSPKKLWHNNKRVNILNKYTPRISGEDSKTPKSSVDLWSMAICFFLIRIQMRRNSVRGNGGFECIFTLTKYLVRTEPGIAWRK